MKHMMKKAVLSGGNMHRASQKNTPINKQQNVLR